MEKVAIVKDIFKNLGHLVLKQPKSNILRPRLNAEIPKWGLIFSSKVPKWVDVVAIKWHTLAQKCRTFTSRGKPKL